MKMTPKRKLVPKVSKMELLLYLNVLLSISILMFLALK